MVHRIAENPIFFCTVMQLLRRFQLTHRVTRSLCDSWAYCRILLLLLN